MTVKRRSLGELLRMMPSGLLSLVRFRSKAEISHAESESDVELRDRLWQALNAVEPGFLGIVEVRFNDNEVIYAVAPEDALLHFRRSYADGTEISLGEERTEVEPVTEWKPVNAQAAQATAPCGCGKPAAASSSTTPPKSADSAQGEVMHKHAERITALIANQRSPWKESDRKYLETLESERLKELETHATQVETDAAAAEEARKKAEQEAQGAQGAPATANTTASLRKQAPAASTVLAAAAGDDDPDAWKKNAPPHVIEMLEQQELEKANKRKEMIKTLSARLKGKPQVARLEKMTDEALTDLMAVTEPPSTDPKLQNVDFSGRQLAGARQAQQEQDDEHTVPPAPKMSALIRKNRETAAAR